MNTHKCDYCDKSIERRVFCTKACSVKFYNDNRGKMTPNTSKEDVMTHYVSEPQLKVFDTSMCDKCHRMKGYCQC